MTSLLISYISANFPALETVQADISARTVSITYHLGDLVETRHGRQVVGWSGSTHPGGRGQLRFNRRDR